MRRPDRHMLRAPRATTPVGRAPRGTGRRAPAGQRGFSLIDALIALGILAFGLLGMTRLQSRTIAQATDSQARMIAVQYSGELLSSALVDATNYACYTLPAAGTCGSPAARALTTDWNTRLAADRGLLNGAATSVYNAATGQLTVRITWSAKGNNDDGSQDAHRFEATTDVRQ